MDALTTLARVPRRPPRSDIALTSVLLVWALIEAVTAPGPGALWQRALFAAGVVLPLLVRRRAPTTVVGLLIGVLMLRVFGVPGAEESTFPFPSMLVAVFSVALHARRVEAAVGGGLATLAAMMSLYPLGYYSTDTPGQVFILAFFIVGAWSAGWLVRVRAAQVDTARQEAVQRAADAVTAERERIARELHDVVAHSLSIVAVQAGAAEELIAIDPELARRHVAAARRTAREALTEMRHVLHVQRDTADGHTAELTPQPTLERVGELVTSAGLPATLTVEGERGEVAAGVDLAGYRIVQEALTNVRRHAGPVETTVHVTYAQRWIDVAVRNAPGTVKPSGDGPGRGLIGMQERATLYGGTVTAEPEGGGFAVRARLPRGTT